MRRISVVRIAQSQTLIDLRLGIARLLKVLPEAGDSQLIRSRASANRFLGKVGVVFNHRSSLNSPFPSK